MLYPLYKENEIMCIGIWYISYIHVHALWIQNTSKSDPCSYQTTKLAETPAACAKLLSKKSEWKAVSKSTQH